MGLWSERPDLIEYARERYLDWGWTCSQVANGLYDDHQITVTRNAVVGLVFRKGWSREGAQGKQRVIETKEVKISVPRRDKRNNRPTKAQVLAQPIELQMEPKTILQLGARHCRFVIGEPDSDKTFFCGAVTADGFSYCQYHHRLCHIPLNERSGVAAPRIGF